MKDINDKKGTVHVKALWNKEIGPSEEQKEGLFGRNIENENYGTVREHSGLNGALQKVCLFGIFKYELIWRKSLCRFHYGKCLKMRSS